MKIVCTLLGHKLKYPEFTCVHCHKPARELNGTIKKFNKYNAEWGNWFLNIKAPYCIFRIMITRWVKKNVFRRLENSLFIITNLALLPVGLPASRVIYLTWTRQKLRKTNWSRLKGKIRCMELDKYFAFRGGCDESSDTRR